MPMYEYQCPKCDERFEKVLTLAEFEVRKPTCPKCKARGKRVMFAPAVHTRLSLMHPRHMRGQKGEFKQQKGVVMR